MKSKILFFMCGILCANDAEILQKAMEFEAKGDYKNAMIYYKKLALRDTAPQKIGTKKEQIPTPNLEQNSQNSKPNSTQNSGFLGLQYYEPIYILFMHDSHKKNDRSSNEAHFSFSFERPLSYDLFGFGEKIAFAYTQNSWWQVTHDSSPFRETNYKPELYASWAPNFADEVKVGILHESNGKDGADSRSWNHLYAQSTWKWGGFEITPRAWYAFWLDQRNKDISEYMGYGDLRASYSFGRHRLSAKLRNNLRFNSQNRGAIELDFTFPLFDTGLYGYLRYFSGYGESLIDYKKSVDKFGAGIAFIEF